MPTSTRLQKSQPNFPSRIFPKIEESRTVQCKGKEEGI
jgi:hypothetical protein